MHFFACCMQEFCIVANVFFCNLWTQDCKCLVPFQSQSWKKRDGNKSAVLFMGAVQMLTFEKCWFFFDSKSDMSSKICTFLCAECKNCLTRTIFNNSNGLICRAYSDRLLHSPFHSHTALSQITTSWKLPSNLVWFGRTINTSLAGRNSLSNYLVTMHGSCSTQNFVNSRLLNSSWLVNATPKFVGYQMTHGILLTNALPFKARNIIINVQINKYLNRLKPVSNRIANTKPKKPATRLKLPLVI